MEIAELIRQRRTIRRFEPREVPGEVLREMVDCARLAPSAANLQPLEYVVVSDPELSRRMYGMVKFGSYLKGDEEIGENLEERPGAYIAILIRDTGVKWSTRDIGAAVQSMLLVAQSRGLATCWMANIKRQQIRELLGLPQDLELDCAVAVGYPAESSRPVPMQDSALYYYEKPLNLCVPKRPLETVLHINAYGQKS
jgi:nitroreductase